MTTLNEDKSEKSAATSPPHGSQAKGLETETEDEDANEETRRNDMVQGLARKYSHASGANGGGENPFVAYANDPDSPLNPNSEEFSGRAWAKAIVDMVSSEGHQFRTSGVAYQHLNVFGFGAGTDYQKNIANIWLDIATLPRKLLGGPGGGGTRIDILRDIDGVVHNGEMLVVLGPPGSGCSTFLKTIAGEMNGIYVEDNSYFNYQGMYHQRCPFPRHGVPVPPHKLYHHC